MCENSWFLLSGSHLSLLLLWPLQVSAGAIKKLTECLGSDVTGVYNQFCHMMVVAVNGLTS